MMELLMTLLLAHLLADFPLQSNLIASLKNNSKQVLALHVFVHMLVLWGLLGVKWQALPLVIFVGLAHFLVDWLKPRLLPQNGTKTFILDQLAHVGCLVLAAVGEIKVNGASIYPVISHDILYLALTVSFCLALMVYYWLWTNTLQDEIVQRHRHLRWSRARLLVLQQRTGLGLVCLIGLNFFLRH